MRRLARTLQASLLTLTILCAIGLHRTWDLRTHTGDALTLPTGRHRAYGYRITNEGGY